MNYSKIDFQVFLFGTYSLPSDFQICTSFAVDVIYTSNQVWIFMPIDLFSNPIKSHGGEGLISNPMEVKV